MVIQIQQKQFEYGGAIGIMDGKKCLKHFFAT
jgi:hypothetical protein